jgi:hypothetical protein
MLQNECEILAKKSRGFAIDFQLRSPNTWRRDRLPAVVKIGQAPYFMLADFYS